MGGRRRTSGRGGARRQATTVGGTWNGSASTMEKWMAYRKIRPVRRGEVERAGERERTKELKTLSEVDKSEIKKGKGGGGNEKKWEGG